MATAAINPKSTRRQVRAHDPLSLQVLESITVLAVAGYLTLEAARAWPELRHFIPELVPWILVVAVSDLAPVPIWGSVQLMISFPVLLAAALVYPPYVAGLLSLVATVDMREFRREIPLMRSLFNRSNVALSVLCASFVFNRIGGDVQDWPFVLWATLVALITDLAVNATLLTAGTHLLTRIPIGALIVNVYGGRYPAAFLLAYACFGLLALLLASVYVVGGSWALVAFSIPLLMARLMFVHWKKIGEDAAAIEAKERALSLVTSQIAQERKDERLAVAAGIHDEVLPPLFKVHLLGQVLRHDLAAGRLLDLEADVPDLLRAVEAADGALRDLIHDLRKSAIGPGGLLETLHLLAREAESQSNVRIRLQVAEVGGSPLTQLLAYQLVREALANAMKHAEASEVVISVAQEDRAIRIAIADDGRGFSPLTVDRSNHFGLQLCRERVELAGGVMAVDTSPGAGTTVHFRLPVDWTPQDQTP